MDPKDFGISTLPLHHAPYGPILTEALVGANAGRVCVVTGAGRGIGQAIARALATSGAKLAILDLRVEGLETTKAACQAAATSGTVVVEAFGCDVSAVADFRQTLKLIKDTLGPIDVLVNCAGGFYDNMMSQESFELFWKAVEINFKGSMLAMYDVLPEMRQRRSGCVINISSRSATVDMLAGLSYNSSKAALTRATSTLQAELEEEGFGQDVQIYSLHPGAVWSDMNTENSTLEEQAKLRDIFKDMPELCANTVTYLAAGRAKELRGAYFDCRQDIEKVNSFGFETLKKYGLYNLRVDFLPGYENEP